MTTYRQIFELALDLYNDPMLVQWPEEDLTTELYGHLNSAILKLPQLKNVTADRDEFDIENVENTGFKTTLSDTDVMALALAMKRAWLEPQIASTTLTWQRSSKKEAYSQKEHLSGLMALDESINIEIKKLLRDDTYVNNEYFN